MAMSRPRARALFTGDRELLGKRPERAGEAALRALIDTESHFCRACNARVVQSDSSC